MISLEVRRTLVKSPPELWAELSDPARLAGHLRELGDIRIVGTDPEETVEWEAQDTRGSVHLQPSGWGTKVTLTVLREIPAPEPPAASGASGEPEPDLAGQAPAGPQWAAEAQDPVAPQAPAVPERPAERAFLLPQSPAGPEASGGDAPPTAPVGPEASAGAEPSSGPEPQAPDGPQPGAEVELTPRRGFFARLFGRRRRGEAPDADPPDSVEADWPMSDATVPLGAHDARIAADEPVGALGSLPVQPAIGAPETEAGRRPGHVESVIANRQGEPYHRPVDQEAAIAAAGPVTGQAEEALVPPAASGVADISAELRTAEEVAAEQVNAMLTSMLDRLGAAHHRPFSRA